MMWHPIDTLFDEIGDSDKLKIVLAEFGQDGLEMYDREASARKIFDGKAMHIDSWCDSPTHWMKRSELSEHLKGKKFMLSSPAKLTACLETVEREAQ